MSDEMTRAEFEQALRDADEAIDRGAWSPAAQRILDHDAALRQEIERLTKERDSWQEEACLANRAALDLTQQLAQAEQREAQLRAALEDLVNNIAGLSAYDRIDAINDEVFEQAHQALSQLPTASSRQDGSDQGKTPS